MENSVAHSVDRVHVLNFCLWVEIRCTFRPDGHVGVTSQMALFHVGFGDAQPAQELAQAQQVLRCLIR